MQGTHVVEALAAMTLEAVPAGHSVQADMAGAPKAPE
jgi:hypothetical protein